MNPSSKAPQHATWDVLADLSDDWQESWAELVRRWDSKLRVLLHCRLRGPAARSVDPEDLRQEVWAEAIERFRSFDYRGPGSFYAWLAGIARHKVLHATRRPSNHELRTGHERQAGAGGPSGLLDAIQVTQTSVGHKVADRELIALVTGIVDQLPGRLREVVLLRIYEGRSGREAAALLGVHESTVSVRLGQAIARCAQRLNVRP